MQWTLTFASQYLFFFFPHNLSDLPVVNGRNVLSTTIQTGSASLTQTTRPFGPPTVCSFAAKTTSPISTKKTVSQWKILVSGKDLCEHNYLKESVHPIKTESTAEQASAWVKPLTSKTCRWMWCHYLNDSVLQEKWLRMPLSPAIFQMILKHSKMVLFSIEGIFISNLTDNWQNFGKFTRTVSDAKVSLHCLKF